MKKLILSLGILAGFAFFTTAYGASIFSVFQGGTGVGTFTSSQLLYGNGTNPLSSVATSTYQIGTGLSFSGTIGYLVGGTAGTITNTGVISNSCSSGISCSGTNPSSFTNTGVTSIVAGSNITISGATGAVTVNSTASGGGGSGTVSTSTNETAGFLAYWTSNSATPALLGKVATGTVSASGGITATAGQSIIGSGLTIGCTAAGSGATGCLSSTDWNTFNNKQATIAVTWPITLTGANIGFNGLSTSSALTSGQVVYATGVNTVASTATTTASCGSGTSCTAFTVIGSSPITITATGGAGGGAGTWSTTTSQVAGQLLNYSNNTTDIVTIGSVSATSSSKFYFDSNTVTANFGTPGTTGGSLTVNGQANFIGPIVIGSSTASTTIWGNTATSTFAKGINLTNGGCYAIGGVCLSFTGLLTYDAWTHPSTNVSATTSGLIITASSTIGNGTQVGGLTISGGATTTGFIAVQGTGTSTFAGGVNLTGTDCFATQGTCLQTFIQNATAYKQAASYATAAVLAGTPTYNNGSSGVGATLTEVGTGALVVDGQNPSAGQRVLVKNQADQTTNGIYTVTATGSGIASYILTRATDYNSSLDVYAGTTVPILVGGTANGDTQWTESNTGTIVIGTSNITFIETSTGTAGTVTSIATNNGITGGTITTSGTIGLATINAGVLGAVTNSSVPTSQATSTLFGGASTGGFVLQWSNVTGGLVLAATSSAGTVTAVSVATANGFAGSSSGGATPALTLTTTITGLLKGNGTAISAAALTDFPTQAANTVIANLTGATAAPTAVSTSSLFTGSDGQTLARVNGTWIGVATTTAGTGLAYTGTAFTLGSIAANSVLGNQTGASAIPSALATSSLFTGSAAQIGYFSGTGLLLGTTSINISTNTFVGIASSTPWGKLSVGTGIGTQGASSTIVVAEYRYGKTGNAGTSTAATIDCRTSTQIHWPIGGSATTLTLTGLAPGQRCVVVVENPGGFAAGALTWAVASPYTLLWVGGTAPTQTTTATKQDVWSFLATEGSSTVNILGNQSANF